MTERGSTEMAGAFRTGAGAVRRKRGPTGWIGGTGPPGRVGQRDCALRDYTTSKPARRSGSTYGAENGCWKIEIVVAVEMGTAEQD